MHTEPHKEVSAGVIVYRIDNGRRLYLLVRKARGKKLWEFPKGKIEPGERLTHAALRELREETGITGRPERGFVKSIRFVYQRAGMQIHKRVLHFLMRTDSPKVTLSKEHLVYAWLPANEACRKLLFQNRKLLIEAAERYLQRKAGRSAPQVQNPPHRSRP